MPHKKAKTRLIPTDFVAPEALAKFQTTYTQEQFQTALMATQEFYMETGVTVAEKMLNTEPYKQVFQRILAEHMNSERLIGEPQKERAKIIAALAGQLTPASGETASTK